MKFDKLVFGFFGKILGKPDGKFRWVFCCGRMRKFLSLSGFNLIGGKVDFHSSFFASNFFYSLKFGFRLQLNIRNSPGNRKKEKNSLKFGNLTSLRILALKFYFVK